MNMGNYDDLLMRGFEALSVANWDNVEDGREQAMRIRSGFAEYQDLPHIKVIFLLAVAIKESLTVNRLQQISDVRQHWLDLDSAIETDHLYNYLRPYCQIFCHFAETVVNLDPTNQGNVGKAALLILDLQNRLEQAAAGKQVGVGAARLVTRHWEMLIREYVRQNPLL